MNRFPWIYKFCMYTEYLKVLILFLIDYLCVKPEFLWGLNIFLSFVKFETDILVHHFGIWIYPAPPQFTGYDTRLIFKWSRSVLNSDWSFS